MRFRLSVAAPCFLAACLALAAGCAPSEAPEPRPNVVLILVDTARADRLSLYGYPRATTPALERRAKSGVVFETARSQAACTFPSVNSLLTSQSPHHFLKQRLGDWSIPEGISSIAEILRRHGYATYAVSASSVVRATPSRQNKTGGYGRGFDVFDESCERQPGKCVSQRGLALVRRSPAPYFLYLHYMDPHHPYAAPQGFRHHFARPAPPPTSPQLRRGDPKPLLRALYEQGQRGDWSAALRYLSDSYDDEIRYFDVVLEKLLSRLEQNRKGRDTLVVLTSDHGEDFLEHEHLMHCRSLYETSIRVPLVMWIPGVAGRRVAEPVENLDIVPTILDYLGIDPGADALEGRSLRSRIEGHEEPSSPTWAAQSDLRAVVTDGYKLIYDLRARNARLFDLANDPAERNDLAEADPERAGPLEKLLSDRVAATEARGDATRPLRLSEEVEKGLRALGYLE